MRPLLLLVDETHVVEDVCEVEDPAHLGGVEEGAEPCPDDRDHLADGLERHLLSHLGECLLEDARLEGLLSAPLDGFSCWPVGERADPGDGERGAPLLDHRRPAPLGCLLYGGRLGVDERLSNILADDVGPRLWCEGALEHLAGDVELAGGAVLDVVAVGHGD